MSETQSADEWPPLLDADNHELANELVDKKNDARGTINRITHDLENDRAPTSEDIARLCQLADDLRGLSANLCCRFPEELPDDQPE